MMIRHATQPFQALLRRTPLAWMLALLLGLGLIPAALFGSLFVQQSQKDIRFAQQEVAGLKYLTALWPAYTLTTDPRDPATVDRRARQIAPALATAAAQYDTMMKSAVQSKTVLDDLRTASTDGRRGSRKTTGTLMTRVGDQSNLILDPDLDTYYLMDIVLLKLRDLSEGIARAQTVKDSEQAQVAGAAITDAAAALATSAKAAVEGNPDNSLAKTPIISRAKAIERAAVQYAAAIEENPSLADDTDALESARDAMWRDAARELDRLLDARIDRLQTRLNVSLAVAALAALAVLILGMMLIRSVASNLHAITGRLDDLSAGDFKSPVPAVGLQNEIGVIARALGGFIEQAWEREALSQALATEREANQRALEETVERVNIENAGLMRVAAERHAIAALAASLEDSISGVLAATRAAAGEMESAAGNMAEVAGVTQDHSGRAAGAAGAAGHIRNAVEEAAPRVAEIAGRLRDLRDQSDNGRTLAEEAIARVNTASERMRAFNDSTARIDSMQATISTIARQTNMLALNAAIEAMRVGEAGQGFMVVANEVKALSDSTQQTTTDIADQIAGMRDANASVIAAFDAIMDALSGLATNAQTISGDMAAQSENIGVVEAAMNTAHTTVVEMTDSIAGSDAAARAAHQTAGGIASSCNTVVTQFTVLDSTIAEFTSGMKRAQAAT
jgi:methyl-accepting chemotaxis protein